MTPADLSMMRQSPELAARGLSELNELLLMHVRMIDNDLEHPKKPDDQEAE